MHCPEGSTNESVPLYLLVPGSSLSHGNMEEFQDPWQGRQTLAGSLASAVIDIMHV